MEWDEGKEESIFSVKFIESRTFKEAKERFIEKFGEGKMFERVENSS